MLQPGLYEQVINALLSRQLLDIPEQRIHREDIDKAESSKILTQYISEIVQAGLDTIADNGGDVPAQVGLVNRIVDLILQETKEPDFQEMSVDERAQQLLSLLKEGDSQLALGKKASDFPRPETSIARSSLFTGAVHEPQMFAELKKEIRSADRIEMLVSFIKWSGLRLLIDELRDFTQGGGNLRIITTSYMGATDLKAIEELQKLTNTEIKVSYDTKRTRLHAKAYIFYRWTGFTTAYIGSSNMSNAAISSGLEWNVKATVKDLPDTIQKVQATFESYWNSAEFEDYAPDQKERLSRALKEEKSPYHTSLRNLVFDIRPYPYQQEILDKLRAEREVRDQYENLIVAATGTGKTVISAFDYLGYRKAHPQKKSRLFFVAHREEILRQALDTFQGILRDPNFGELFVGNYRPMQLDHLFISIQTMNSQALFDRLPADHFDYIVVDEFHHAAAPTYKKMLEHFQPQILLGLTATPERLDGKSILDYFNGRISAEIRLPEAIDRKLLSPFQYFGVSDTVDLSNLTWVRGGYDKGELSNLLSLDRKVAEKRADHVVLSIDKYVTDLDEVKGLGFCVSVEHAHFMSEYFNKVGIPSLALVGTSPQNERDTAKRRLVSGELRFLFVVDLYNEGVDIPEVNTVLFLRPTESLTIFLQQLGRGLRLAEGKECLTVLDFIGAANRKYNFEEKFQALLTNTRRSIKQEIQRGFVSVPKGCYIQLEKKAERAVLENIRSSFSMQSGLVQRIESFEKDTGLALTLSNFLDFYHLDPRMLYQKRSFSRLCVFAGVRDDFAEEIETAVTRALPRLASIDSRRWISFLLEILNDERQDDFKSALTTTAAFSDWYECTLTPAQQRMLRMFYITIWQQSFTLDSEKNNDQDSAINDRSKSRKGNDLESARTNMAQLMDSPVMLQEITELLAYNFSGIDFIDQPVELGFDSPLDLHCSYSRDQVLTAFDFENPSSFREGVKWFAEKEIDVFFITLNKSDKDYSPSTMYHDYSINDRLFHWQSQSTTKDTSPTGQRYIEHQKRGSKVVLFVREYKEEQKTTSPYTYLGTATYVEHTGSRPMNIVWRLDQPIPAKFLKKTNKLLVG